MCLGLVETGMELDAWLRVSPNWYSRNDNSYSWKVPCKRPRTLQSRSSIRLGRFWIQTTWGNCIERGRHDDEEAKDQRLFPGKSGLDMKWFADCNEAFQAHKNRQVHGGHLGWLYEQKQFWHCKINYTKWDYNRVVPTNCAQRENDRSSQGSEPVGISVPNATVFTNSENTPHHEGLTNFNQITTTECEENRIKRGSHIRSG